MSLGDFLMWTWVLFFVCGFTVMVFVACWAFVTITRMKREQAHAITMLAMLVQQTELKQQVDRIHAAGG